MSLLNTPETFNTLWRLTLFMTPFILGLTGLSMTVHLACSRHYHVLTYALRRSKCLTSAIQVWGAKGTKSRISVVSTLNGVALCPRYFVKRGLVHADDAIQFPCYLKRRMQVASWLLISGMTWLILGAFIRH